jgi:hypothetical protein
MFLGDWKLNEEQGTLNIEKTGETYKCIWKINKENNQHEYLGIGMFVDNQLLISRFSNKVPGGGIGLYKPIGDLRSNSALWASTKSLNVLGSGIALREDASEKFEGSYKVRYFLKGNEISNFNLNIRKKESCDLYSLTWAIEDNVILHGIGLINNKQIVLAWGGIDFEYELVILSIGNKNTLNGKCALLNNSSITEEIYTKY